MLTGLATSSASGLSRLPGNLPALNRILSSDSPLRASLAFFQLLIPLNMISQALPNRYITKSDLAQLLTRLFGVKYEVEVRCLVSA